MLPFQGEDGGRLAGLASNLLGSVSDGPTAVVFSSSTAAEMAALATEDDLALLMAGLIGAFLNRFTGIFSSIPSSSSDSTRLIVSWVTFLGLSGIGFSTFSPISAVVAAALVLRAVRGAEAEAALRTGFPRKPFVDVGAEDVADAFLANAASGTMFSFSGSSNLTVFLTAGLAVVVRADFFSAAVTGSTSCATAFLTRVVLGIFTHSCAGASATFLGLPRVRTAVAGAGSGAGSGTSSSAAAFFGRPRPRVGFEAAAVVFLAGCISRSSSSLSSDGLFLLSGRFVVVVVVVVVVVRTVLALAASVTTRVGLRAGSDVFAAARARVILFGGDSASIVADCQLARGFVDN